jgi:ribosomal protein S18 acetylase RimI-like enzyme
MPRTQTHLVVRQLSFSAEAHDASYGARPAVPPFPVCSSEQARGLRLASSLFLHGVSSSWIPTPLRGDLMTVLAYTIRRAQPADVSCLLELRRELQDHMEGANPDLWRMTAEARGGLRSRIAGRLKDARACVLVAEHRDDGVVGLVSGRIVTNKRYTPSRAGIVDQAYVRPKHRRRGLGSRLVSELCRFFSAEGVTDITLRFVAGNEQAAGFWTALGFAPRIVIAGAGLDATRSRLDLDFTE